MTGVISPTNLSMYSSTVPCSRSNPRSSIPRWNTPLFTLDQEDFNMIAHQANTEPNAIILMEDGSQTTTTEHSSQCCTSGSLLSDADRFFQGSDLETSTARDNDHMTNPTTP